MDTSLLKKIGLTENEIKIYLALLARGSSTAYDISKETSIYRVHVYDKLSQLSSKGLVTYILKGSKKYFQATPPEKIGQYLDEKKKEIEDQQGELKMLLPELEELRSLPRTDTNVEVFSGVEGLKYFLKDMIKEGKAIAISGIDDAKYQEMLPTFMQQYFRDIRKLKISERIITSNRKEVFMFDKKLAPNTEYRFLDQGIFNPTNTFIYGKKVVIVTFGVPITAIMIKNESLAKTYLQHFEYLWKIAKST